MVFEEHPVQYRAPVYRYLQQELGVPVTVIYKNDSSISGGYDKEFGVSISWDSDVLSGYCSRFLLMSSKDPAQHPVPSNIHLLVSRLCKEIRETRPDAILLLGYKNGFDWAAILSAIKTNIPFYFRAETTDHAHFRSRLKGLCRDNLLSYFYRRCTRLLYIGSRSRCHYLRLRCDERKLIFSPYCVDTVPFKCGEGHRELLRAEVRNNLGIKTRQTVLLFSGKLSLRKGPDVLLAAIGLLPIGIRDELTIVFMGSGEMADTLKSQASTSGLANRIHFVGFQNQMALSRYYHAADALVMPSRYGETWGLVVNEALHHGIPCVVTDAVGSAPDLIQPGVSGETASADSSLSLASAIIRILPMLGSRQIRDNCRTAVSHYSVEAAATGIASAVAGVLA